MSTRTKLFGAAVSLIAGALMVSGLVVNTPSALAEDDSKLRKALAVAQDEAPAKLQTAFEQSGGRTWTTHPQSLAFYRALDAATDKVKVTNIGRTIQGRPLQLVAVGAPAPKSQAEAAAGSVALFTCSVHGNENSGRESCMQLARDLALSTDSAVTRMLERTTMLFVSVNPDGWMANTRGNANGVDVNRDYMGGETPEARAVLKVIRDWKPDVLNDLHEYGTNEYYNTALLHLWPRNRNVDPEIHKLSFEMSNDYSSRQATSQGHSSGIYGHFMKDGKPFLQVAGDGQARILRNYAGLVNSVGMLSEAANDPLTPQEAADPAVLNNRRVAVNYASALGSVQMVMENRQELITQTAAAATRNTDAGHTGAGVVYFGGQDDMIPTDSDQVEPEPMCAYRVSTEEFTSVRTVLALHGIKTTATSGGRLVSMAQPTRGLIPLLFDERSEYRIAEGTPVSC